MTPAPAGGYVVAEPPAGAKLDYVPDEVSSRSIDGSMYFAYNDVCYRSFPSGSRWSTSSAGFTSIGFRVEEAHYG